jgi:hypothetical protein
MYDHRCNEILVSGASRRMFSTKCIWIVPVAVLVLLGEAHAFGAYQSEGISVSTRVSRRHGQSFPHPVFLCSAADTQKEQAGKSLRSFFKNNSRKTFKLTTRGRSNMTSNGDEEAPSTSKCIRLSKRQKVSDFVKTKIMKAPLAILAKLKERRLSNGTGNESDNESVIDLAPEFWKDTKSDDNGSTAAPRKDVPSVQDSMNIISSASKRAEVEIHRPAVEVTKETNSVAKVPSEMLVDAVESGKAVVEEVTIKETVSLEDPSSDETHAEDETVASVVVAQVKEVAEATVDVASATLQKTKSLNNAYRERIKSTLQRKFFFPCQVEKTICAVSNFFFELAWASCSHKNTVLSAIHSRSTSESPSRQPGKQWH